MSNDKAETQFEGDCFQCLNENLMVKIPECSKLNIKCIGVKM